MTEPPAAGISALILMGSNIEPELNMRRALEELARSLDVRRASRLFSSAAVGGARLPRFLNAAVEVRTVLAARSLKFEVLRRVEGRLGRRRGADRNAPRTIDLDISLFGDDVIADREAELEIPDPEILTRAHVAVPLADLAPDRIHPVTGSSLESIARGLGPGADVRPAADPESLRRRLASVRRPAGRDG